METNLNQLKTNMLGIDIYQAGLPDYPRNFSRDSIIAAIIMKDSDMLKKQLILCSKLQGKKVDSFTAEEPGKIHHEYPEVIWNELSTVYNACDTTALFLIGHKFYQDFTKDKTLAKVQKENIEKAIDYILSHLENYLFIDDPKFCKSEKFALPITYWKDSWLPNRNNFEPVYPVSYFLAHIQNMIALRLTADLLDLKNLRKIANKMRKKIKYFYNPHYKDLYIAIDKKGPINVISSDFLHSLFYLEPQDISKKILNQITRLSKELETPAGYRTQDKKSDSQKKDDFYVDNVCPFEQALINIGSKKFNLINEQEISSRVKKFLVTEPELLVINEKNIKTKGSDPQLWTIATKEYFNSISSS